MSNGRVEAIAAYDRPWAYVVLTKPDVTFLVVITTVAGFYLASNGSLDWLRLINTLCGTLLVAGGTAALNQYIERHMDSVMRRTANRPLPTGILQPKEVLIFGVATIIAGTVWLLAAVNALSAFLALATSVSYLAAYTPLKTRTTLATAVGAVPGALPPLIGWAAAHGSLSLGAWVLFAILFVWQFPHFMAIAWMYREDYGRAGNPDASGGRSHRRQNFPPHHRHLRNSDPRQPAAGGHGHGWHSLFLRRSYSGPASASGFFLGQSLPHQRPRQVADARHGRAHSVAPRMDDSG